jgi:hypothetical protein
MRKLLISIVLVISQLIPISAFADPASISISNISVDKTALNAGSQLTVTFNMSSSNLTIDMAQKNSVSVYRNDFGECDDGDCPTAAAILTSGNASNGVWRATLTIPSNTISGSYTPVIVFTGLKGVSGNIGYSRNKVLITASTAVPSTTPSPLKTVQSSSKPTPVASSSTKKITITCIKGKLSKTVIATKPTCPAGYKKK